MSECGELPYLDGMGDVMMVDDSFKNSIFGGDVKEEESEPFSFASTLNDIDTEWNMDTMSYDDTTLGDLFPVCLFGNGNFGDAPTIDSLLNESFPKPPDSAPLKIGAEHAMLNGSPVSTATDTTTTNVNSVLSDFESSLLNNTLAYGGLINGNNNNNTIIGMNSSFEEIIPSLSISELLESKEEEMQMSSDVGPSMGLAPQTTVDCKLSPSYSVTSELWDSGVSADDEASPPGLRLDQQLSPLSDYTATSPTPDYLSSSFNSPRPLCTPLRSPSSGTGSGYCSSSSPSCSPNSSPLPTLAPVSHPKPLFTTVSAVAAAAPVSAAATRATNLFQPSATAVTTTSTATTPHFYIQKRPHANTNKYTINKVFSNGLSTNKQPITVVSTNINNGSSAITKLSTNNTTTARVTTSTVMSNKPQLLSTVVGSKVLQHRGSASPSVVTLSGVNKTAGIIKSPSVINVSRKQPINTITTTTINTASNNCNNNISSITVNNTSSNNNTNIITGIQQQPQQKPINIISTSGELVSSNIISSSNSNNIITSNGNVYKPIKLSHQGRIISGPHGGQQIVLQTRNGTLTTGKIIKSQSNYIIPLKGGDKISKFSKVHQFKLISAGTSSSSSVGGSTGTLSASPMRANTVLRSTFLNHNRTRINGVNTVTSSPGVRATNVSILKNVCLPMGKTLQAVKDSVTGLVTIPKEEILDSDDDVEVHKNNQPLVLTDEERKLAAKENTKFPSHYPLTRNQERDLKRIRRKLRNKQSAQDSRKRKKDHLDNLLTEVDAKANENAELKLRLVKLEETNKQLAEQLKKFQALMNSQSAPSVSRNNSHHSSNSRQQHPSTFLLMMVLSIALFVYPSVLPQSKTATELLTAVAHRMPPAGNSRSLLEAASAKLSVCQDDDTADEDIDLDTKSIAALTDHDYEPPSKRGRFSFSSSSGDLYCMPQLDDRLPSPRKKQLPDGGGGGSMWHDGKDDGDENKGKAFDTPDGISYVPPDENSKPNKSSVTLFKSNADALAATAASVVKFDPDLATKISQGVLDSMKSQLENNHNWTQPDVKRSLDSLSQSLVVELATSGTKLFREDIELE